MPGAGESYSMSNTIGLVANVYNEINALPGWLETHLPFFDDVRVLHAGPQGRYSYDGTIELLERWRVPVEFCAIDDGFGVVRTRAIHMSPCDWVMILDADERFFSLQRLVECRGNGTPQEQVDWILQGYDFRGVNLPNWENIAKLGENLSVFDTGATLKQGDRLREVINSDKYDAISTVRRHWHDLGMKRPTQDWRQHPDPQLRLIKNDSRIFFDPNMRMHEQLRGAASVSMADVNSGPFFDHFHFTFKRMEQEQRGHDVATYDSIHAGRTPSTWEEFLVKGK